MIFAYSFWLYDDKFIPTTQICAGVVAAIDQATAENIARQDNRGISGIDKAYGSFSEFDSKSEFVNKHVLLWKKSNEEVRS